MVRKRSKKNSRPKPAKFTPVRQLTAWPVPMSVIVLLCVASAVPGTFVGSSIGFSDHYREAVAEVGFLGLLVWWLWRNRHVRQSSLTFSWTRLWLGGLLLLGGASAFWTADPSYFASKYLLWLAAAAALGMTLTMHLSLDAMLQLARGLALIVVYISVIGLIQVLFSTDIFMQTSKPAANYHNRNAAMQVIVLAFPMIVFMLLFERRRELSILSWFALVLGYGYAFHTTTRSGWLALLLETLIIVGALVWLWRPLKAAAHEGLVTWHRAHKFAAPAALLLLVALVSLSADGWRNPYTKVFARAATLQEDFSSYSRARPSERYRIWDDALKMVAENPVLGTGMGSFFYNLLTDSSKYEITSVLRVHNDILEIGVELGVVGMLVFLAGAIGLAGVLFTVVWRGDLTMRVFFLIITAALTGSALQAQFSFPYQMPVPVIIFGVYAGLILKAGGGRVKHINLQAYHWNVGLSTAGIVLVLTLALNLAWLNTLSTIETNTRYGIWHKPIHLTPPLCHRSIVRLLVGLASFYQNSGESDKSLGVTRSLESCIPGSWMTEQFMIMSYYNKRNWAQTLPLLLRSRQHAPVGNYRDYINLMAVHTNMSNPAAAQKVFEELIAQPEEYLIKRKDTLHAAVLFALQIRRMEEAKRFYRLLRLHYSSTPKIEAQILAIVPAEHAESFLAWQKKLEAELSAGR